MHLKFCNVNEAFTGLVRGIHTGTIPTTKKPSRVGEVLTIEEPMTITYERPIERVLFNIARDASPAFHLYEALWMLAGRNDLAPLQYYVSTFDSFSDDGEVLNGAYGYRWRHARSPETRIPPKFRDNNDLHLDQLNVLVEHLKQNPGSRRAVLQMWNVEDDLLKIGFGLCQACDGEGSMMQQWGKEAMLKSRGRALPFTDGRKGVYYVNAQGEEIGLKTIGGPCSKCGGSGQESYSKDVCCNLSVMFSLRTLSASTGGFVDGEGAGVEQVLDMTVTNRSNDMIWGMLGANIVHFSFLQEYMAARLGVQVGVYNHFTNNLHVYTERWEPGKWLDGYGPNRDMHSPRIYSYEKDVKLVVPLVHDAATFEEELPAFVTFNAGAPQLEWRTHWREPFLDKVAQPLLYAFHFYKQKDFKNALASCDDILAEDWKIAAINWLKKRKEKADARSKEQALSVEQPKP